MTDAAIHRLWAVRQRAKNFACSFTFVSAAYLAYRFLPHVEGLRQTWSERAGISGLDVLNAVYVGYSALLLAFYALEPQPREAKAAGAVRALISLATSPLRTWQHGLAPVDRLGLLTMLLKGFFAPLMVMSLFAFTAQLIENGAYIARHVDRLGEDFLSIFNSHGFWFLLQLILFVDVFFFTVGYMIEHPILRNEIRSVDSTWLGWGVTLICYPPINQLTVSILGGNVAEFPQFDDPVVHVAINLAILMLMGIYASASVALNLKGSNLTHRGIIDYGPYRYIRHPAYVCKNAAWWLGTLPAVMVAWQQSAWQALLVVGSAVAWTCIYALRALTEEDHLKRVDCAYEEYCRRVPHRFIPGVY